MALFKNGQHLGKSESAEFDKGHQPGVRIPHSGIYRCEGCGYEAPFVEGETFPPTQTCAQHNPRWKIGAAPVTWRLLVYAVHFNE